MPALLPALGQQRSAAAGPQLQPVGDRPADIHPGRSVRIQVVVDAMDQIGGEQQGTARPAQLLGGEAVHGGFAGQGGGTAGDGMPDVMAMADAQLQIGGVAIGSRRQQRGRQGLEALIDQQMAIGVAEAACRQGRQAGQIGPGAPVALSDQRGDGGVGPEPGAGRLGRRRGIAGGEQIKRTGQIAGIGAEHHHVGGQALQLGSGLHGASRALCSRLFSYQSANSGTQACRWGHIRSQSSRISCWASSLARRSRKCRKARSVKLTTKCWR